MKPTPMLPPLPLDAAREAAKAAHVPESLLDLNVFRVLLRHPKLAGRLIRFGGVLLTGGKLDPQLRELLIMRVAWRTDSVYEWTQHWGISKATGLPDDKILAVRRFPDDPGGLLTETERTVLVATDELLDHGMIRPETLSDCRRLLVTDENLIELVAAVGNWRLFSSFLKTFDVPVEPHLTPWAPDGVGPNSDLYGRRRQP